MRNRRLNRKQDVHFLDKGFESMQVRQPSLVDSFYHEEYKDPNSGKIITRFSHPLYMLFNQERLDRMGANAAQMWLKSLDNAKNSAVSELKQKLSDDELLHMVKSRHCQHPSEVESYIQRLKDQEDYLNSEISRIFAEENQKQIEQKTAEMLGGVAEKQ